LDNFTSISGENQARICSLGVPLDCSLASNAERRSSWVGQSFSSERVPSW